MCGSKLDWNYVFAQANGLALLEWPGIESDDRNAQRPAKGGIRRWTCAEQELAFYLRLGE